VPRPRRVVRRSAIDRVRWDRLGRTALLVLLVIVAGVYVQDILSYLSARGQADQQSATVKRLTRENTQLTREQHTLEDPTTVVLEARALGMVRPGERPYVVTGLPQR
jgi:cell division protein FtsB